MEKDNIKDNLPTLNNHNKAVFLVRKTEKLTAALYKITEFIPNEEPLKWKIRQPALELLVIMLSFIDNLKDVNISVFNNSISEINKVVSLLEVTFMGSFVSNMNFSILKEEYLSLKEEIANYKSVLHPSIQLGILPEEIEKEKRRYFMPENKDIYIKDTYKGHNTDYSYNKGQQKSIKDYKRQTGEMTEKARTTSGINTPGEYKRNTGQKDKRRNMIIDYIKNNGEVSIKEILTVPFLAENYSEKTIQRELVEMVDRGLIKKAGERRWSKYFM